MYAWSLRGLFWASTWTKAGLGWHHDPGLLSDLARGRGRRFKHSPSDRAGQHGQADLVTISRAQLVTPEYNVPSPGGVLNGARGPHTLMMPLCRQ